MNHPHTVSLPQKVTIEDMQAKVKKSYYHYVPDTTLTLCVLTLENGFTVTGQSACVDPALYDKVLGEYLAYRDAFEKIWNIEGYLLAQQRYEAGLT